MKEGKEQKHSKSTFAVAIIATLLMAALIGYIALKVKRSLSRQAFSQVQDTTAKPSIIPRKAINTETAAQPNDSSKLARLFNQYFQKDSIPHKYPSFLSEALMGYSFNDYSYLKELNLAALPETYATIEGNNKETILQLGHYYKGIVALLQHDQELAITHLNWCMNHASNDEQLAKAEWYLALTYLQKQDADKAIDLLRKVAMNNADHVLSSKAKNMLKELMP